jgi:hypothetical protein
MRRNFHIFASQKIVEKAIKELMEGGEISCEEARRFLKEFAKRKVQLEGGGPGESFSNDPEVYANKILYNILSERYTLKIRKLPLEESGGIYPKGYIPWEISDPIEDIDPFTSYGIIAPGITKKIERGSLKTFGRREKVPDLLLLLDDSSSMPNPTKKISNAVLASFVVAKNYVRNGASIAPLRFSDRTTTSDWLKDEDQILEELIKFKDGDDTRVDIDVVEKVVGSKDKEKLDAIIITDGKLGSHRDEIVEYLSKFNCPFMLEIGERGDLKREKKVVVYPIYDETDIARVIIDKF